METFEEYLAAKRTQSNGNGVLHGAKGESVQKAAEAVRNARSHMRAVKNWRRAKYAVTKKITEDMLGMQRKCGHILAAPCYHAPNVPRAGHTGCLHLVSGLRCWFGASISALYLFSLSWMNVIACADTAGCSLSGTWHHGDEHLEGS